MLLLPHSPARRVGRPAVELAGLGRARTGWEPLTNALADTTHGRQATARSCVLLLDAAYVARSSPLLRPFQLRGDIYLNPTSTDIDDITCFEMRVTEDEKELAGCQHEGMRASDPYLRGSPWEAPRACGPSVGSLPLSSAAGNRGDHPEQRSRGERPPRAKQRGRDRVEGPGSCDGRNALRNDGSRDATGEAPVA